MTRVISTAWLYLLAAAIFEIGWALGLKLTDGFNRPVITLATLAAMVTSFVLLAKAVESLPVGTAYAVWTGIGATGAVIGGILLFDEPLDDLRILFIALIVSGVVGLKLTSA